MKPSEYLREALQLEKELLKPSKHSDQLRSLIESAKKPEKSNKKVVRQKGVTVTHYSSSAARAGLYKQRAPHGTFEAEKQRTLMRRHGDGPKDHPFVLGLSAYGTLDEVANPFDENGDNWNWLWWFSGWHQARRDLGHRIEEDVA